MSSPVDEGAFELRRRGYELDGASCVKNTTDRVKHRINPEEGRGHATPAENRLGLRERHAAGVQPRRTAEAKGPMPSIGCSAKLGGPHPHRDVAGQNGCASSLKSSVLGRQGSPAPPVRSISCETMR